MPFQKGHKKLANSGRKVGSKNYKTLEVEALVQKLQVNPLEVLLMFSKGDWKGLGYFAESTICYNSAGIEYTKLTISPSDRIAAAKEAVKYVYSQKKAVEVSTKDDEGINVNVFDYSEKKNTGSRA